MIIGIGTDIVAVERFTPWEQYSAERLHRVFTTMELAQELRAESLAVRFAAKEAFAKAIGTGVRAPVLLTAIAVDHDALGKPLVRCRGALADLVEAKGLSTHLSISDEATHAVAFVILEQA